MRRRVPIVLLSLVCSACIESARVNATCTWTEASSQPLNLTSASDRDHLRADVQLAGELGVRLADVRFRGRADLHDPIQQRCTAALMDTIARRHGVASSAVKAAARWRVWWADLLAVYLPIVIVVALGADLLTRRICRSFDAEDRGVAIASLAFLVLLVALFGLGFGQFWAFGVEGWFLRNEHVAFRGSLIPIMRHGWIGYFSMLVLCAGVATYRFANTALQDVGRSFASQRRSRGVAGRRGSAPVSS